MTEIKDSGEREEFDTGAVRDTRENKGRYDLLPWSAIHQVAIQCQLGARKYGERNINKGMPISRCIDSATRHISQYMEGQDDEDHLRAAAWNILWALWMREEKPEMQDIPTRLEDEDGCY